MTLLLLLLACLPLMASEAAFDAKWTRPLRPDILGTLRIGEDGIAFHPKKNGKRTLAWAFEDVQHLDRRSAAEIAVRDYSASTVRLGRGRWYRFVLIEGGFPDELHARVVARIGKPATDRVPRHPGDAELAIPAKRVRLMRGAEGTLYFTPDWIVFSTGAEGGSRAWHLARDVEAVWAPDRFGIEVHVRSRSEGFLRRVTVYRFSLKRPLDTAYYSGLRKKLYDLRNTSQSRPRAGPGSFGWKHVAWRRIRAEGSGSQAP